VTIGDEHPITGDQANSDPVLVADFSELPDEVLHYVNDQLADRLATDGSEVMAEARALGHIEIEGARVEFHDFPVRSLVHAVAREKVADIEREVLAGDRDDYTEAELERFYRVLGHELGDTA